MVRRRIGSDVREIQVKCHESTAFIAANLGYPRIGAAAQGLIPDRDGIMAVLPKKLCDFDRQILVYLETNQTALGKATIRSRASAAAYSSAAWMDSDFNAG